MTDWVRRYLYEWKKVSSRQECTASSVLKEMFEQEKKKLDDAKADVQRLLERAFAFAGEAFQADRRWLCSQRRFPGMRQ